MLNTIGFMTLAGAIFGVIFGAVYAFVVITLVDSNVFQYVSTATILVLGSVFGLAAGLLIGLINGFVLDQVIRRFEFPLIDEQKFFHTLYAISAGLTFLLGIAGFSLLFPYRNDAVLFSNRILTVIFPSIIAMCCIPYATKRLGQRVILQANSKKKKKSVA